jgi:alkyl hydroperoxide reductase subunit AhpC
VLIPNVRRRWDALQLADRQRVAAPADWRPGYKLIVPLSIAGGDAGKAFPQGWEALRPYLCLTTVR